MAEPLPRDGATWRHLTVMAVLNNVVPFTLISGAKSTSPIGLASILNATSPLFGVLVAHLMTARRQAIAGRVIGLIAGFIGVVVLIGPDMLTELGAHVLAELACLAAAVLLRLRRGLFAARARRAAGHGGEPGN